MQHAVLLGRDSWMRFNTRSYRSFPPRPLDQRAFGELTLSHHAPTGASSFVSDLLTSGGGFHLRYDGADCVTLSDEPQLLTVNPLPRLITLENRKGSTNGNAGFLSRLPQPATEHDHSGASRFTPVDDEATYLFRACGLLTSSTSVPGMGLGGLVPQPDSAVLGGLPLTATAFCDFPAHGPRMRVDDLSAPTGRFAARVSAFVVRPPRPRAFLACHRRHFHSGFRGALQGYSTKIIPAGPYATIGEISGTAAYGPHLRTEEQTLRPLPSSLLLNMVSDPAGFSGRFSLGSTLRRSSRALGCLWLLPRAHLEPQRLS